MQIEYAIANFHALRRGNVELPSVIAMRQAQDEINGAPGPNARRLVLLRSLKPAFLERVGFNDPRIERDSCHP